MPVVDADRETVPVEDAEAGQFRDAARRAATEQSLPLLATYVADAPTWQLDPRQEIDTDLGGTDDLAGFVEMRVALAAGRRLTGILRRILGHASFQYTAAAEESVGAVRGQLDVPRYIRTRRRPETPRRYPVRVLRRRYQTPENVLGAYAALSVLEALSRAPLHLLPAGAPERGDLLERRADLAGMLRQPALAEVAELAREVRRRGGLEQLRHDVATRLDTGRVAGADRYRDLLDWVERFDPAHASARGGQVEWAFYDARFDTKLFEIWTLSVLLDALTERVGVPTTGPAPLHERTRAPIAVWRLGAATVAVHFQASLTRLANGEPRWRFGAPDGQPLRGFPDLAVTIDRVGSPRRVVLIDPKLRERTSAPSDELYKLIGYFGNLPTTAPPCGAIVFYTPDSTRHYELVDGADGRLFAIGMDPADGAASAAEAQELADLILDAAGITATLAVQVAAARALGDPEAVDEAVAALVQAEVVQAMSAAAAALPAGSLEPTRKLTAAQLDDVWDMLSTDVTTMVVTAEYFGPQAPSDADHSGPLLGLAAACERLLYEGLFGFLVSHHPQLFTPELTFGGLIHHLSDAFRTTPHSPEGHAIALSLPQLSHIDATALRALVPELRELNVTYRIPAAHRDLISQRTWVAGRAHVLTPPDGVLPRLAHALNASPT
jgi:hypothetical protein